MGVGGFFGGGMMGIMGGMGIDGGALAMEG
jgi:hypothetical protein